MLVNIKKFIVSTICVIATTVRTEIPGDLMSLLRDAKEVS